MGRQSLNSIWGGNSPWQDPRLLERRLNHSSITFSMCNRTRRSNSFDVIRIEQWYLVESNHGFDSAKRYLGEPADGDNEQAHAVYSGAAVSQ